jgi:DNA phosphorothioation-dependent restriction protein DptG
MRQTMSNEAYIIMLKLRYLIPILEKREDDLRQNCEKEEDTYGYRVTECWGKQNGAHNRHQALVDALVALFNSANFHVQKDANVRCFGNSHGGNLRPADILADGEVNNGSKDCIDAAVVSNMC